MRRKLAGIAAALAVAFTAATVTATPAAARCNLHIIYTLYPYADDYPYTTTSYAGYRYFLDHHLGTARYGWYC